MATYNVSNASFSQGSLFIDSLSNATNIRFENVLSTEGNSSIGEYTRTFQTLAFEAGGLTYSYNGIWTLEENRLVSIGAISASGSYDSITVRSNGNEVANYSGVSRAVDFGSVNDIPVIEMTGNTFELLLASNSNATDSYANLNTDATPNLPDLAFEGNDALTGSTGNDTLIGGTGADNMTGGSGSDVYYVDNAGDQVTEIAGQGTDTVYTRISYTLGAGQSVEVLAASQQAATTAINLTGNELGQTVRGNAGNNILDGRGGIDHMYGLAGNDTYYVDRAADGVYEVAGQGSDTVYARVSYALAAGQSIELLAAYKLAGTEAIHLTGNELAQHVKGNAGNNLINGGRGNDTLTGGAGFDTFVFDTTLSSSNNVDTITDFSVPQDSIRLENAIFTALTTGTLAASAFHIGTAAADSLDRIIYNSTNGRLYYDADGTGAGGMSHFATLSTGLAMTNLDFVVV